MDGISRRSFISRAAAATGGLAFAASRVSATPGMITDEISLAAWSLIKEFRAGEWTTLDLPKIARERFDLSGVEYVNTLFEVPTYSYLRQLKRNCEDNGITSVLLMVDAEGSMAATDPAERRQAVINHHKWVDIAHYLGCHSIRTNCHGEDESSREDMLSRAEDSFGRLLEYSVPAGISVIIENHGGLSSDPDFLAALMKRVNNRYFGTLPDFGNFPEGVNKLEAVVKLIPWATGVSVKSYYRPDGSHPEYDLEAIIRACHDAGYRGFYGIEAEAGDWEGYEQVRMTKQAIQRALGMK